MIMVRQGCMVLDPGAVSAWVSTTNKPNHMLPPVLSPGAESDMDVLRGGLAFWPWRSQRLGLSQK